MDQPDVDRTDAEAMRTVSFIVRLWLEEAATEAGQAIWRGHVTHVPSGQRRHFAALDQIAEIVRAHLVEVAP